MDAAKTSGETRPLSKRQLPLRALFVWMFVVGVYAVMFRDELARRPWFTLGVSLVALALSLVIEGVIDFIIHRFQKLLRRMFVGRDENNR